MINILRKKTSYCNLKRGILNYKYEHVDAFIFYFSFALERPGPDLLIEGLCFPVYKIFTKVMMDFLERICQTSLDTGS